MKLKVRHVRFKQSIDLPGKSAAEHCHEDHPREMGYDLELDTDLRLVRISVPDAPYERGVGRWVTPDTKHPVYGGGRVCYVPFEAVLKIELASDVEQPKPPTPEKKPEPQVAKK